MSGANPIQGILVNYDDVIPIPVITYNSTNNALVFNNAVQTTSGIASTEGEISGFNSPAFFKQSAQVRFNANLSDFFPMPLPSDPMSLSVPANQSIGTVQATDLMIAKDGVMKLYSDASGTHIYGDMTVDGNITNNTLQDLYLQE